MTPPDVTTQSRRALVLAGGGARGAYEAGVLAHVFEHVLPRLDPAIGFDIASGTSVGAIHAAFTTATAGHHPAERARLLVDTWLAMELGRVFRLDARDLVGIPLRALGLRTLRPGEGLVGGLVDVSPLEKLVEQAVPWTSLRENLRGPTPRVLCVSCTEVRSGRVTVFMDGPLADPDPWLHDPSSGAITAEITGLHVRASAAIPFLFPAVRIGERYYVDGGLRMNTPLAPALRLRADRVLVVALKHDVLPEPDAPVFTEEVISQPAFLIGKVLDALTLDQIEYELHRIDLINALLEQGRRVYGEDFDERINVAVREQRGVGFRPVRTVTIRPSQDIGRIAARCHRQGGGPRALGLLGELIARAASRGVPQDEADLLSYVYFDSRFTRELVEMGRADAHAREDEIANLLAD